MDGYMTIQLFMGLAVILCVFVCCVIILVAVLLYRGRVPFKSFDESPFKEGRDEQSALQTHMSEQGVDRQERTRSLVGSISQSLRGQGAESQVYYLSLFDGYPDQQCTGDEETSLTIVNGTNVGVEGTNFNNGEGAIVSSQYHEIDEITFPRQNHHLNRGQQEENHYQIIQ